jgi:hypothetical protein
MRPPVVQGSSIAQEGQMIKKEQWGQASENPTDLDSNMALIYDEMAAGMRFCFGRGEMPEMVYVCSFAFE